jgi:hypothetical protein
MTQKQYSGQFKAKVVVGATVRRYHFDRNRRDVVLEAIQDVCASRLESAGGPCAKQSRT